MKGEFRKSIRKYILGFFFLISGSYVAVRFALWGMDELRSGQIASFICCLFLLLGGLLFGSFSILVFRFNHNAFFLIENGEVSARSGWSDELHINISHIKKVEVQGRQLKLYTDDTVIWIYNLKNAGDICKYIRSQIATAYVMPDIDRVKEQVRRSKKAYISYLIATIVAGSFMFLHIAWCVLLTEGKDLSAFTRSDVIVFVAFAFSEVCTAIITFWCASRCGKNREIYNMSTLDLLSASAYEHRHDGLDPYPNLINKKYFDHYVYRILVFSPGEDVFAYMLEQFDGTTLSWVQCYEAAKGFHILSELYDDLDVCFANVILEDG